MNTNNYVMGIDTSLRSNPYDENYFHKYWRIQIFNLLDDKTKKRISLENWSNGIINHELGISREELHKANHHTFDKALNYLKAKKQDTTIDDKIKETEEIIEKYMEEANNSTMKLVQENLDRESPKKR